MIDYKLNKWFEKYVEDYVRSSCRIILLNIYNYRIQYRNPEFYVYSNDDIKDLLIEKVFNDILFKENKNEYNKSVVIDLIECKLIIRSLIDYIKLKDKEFKADIPSDTFYLSDIRCIIDITLEYLLK